MTSDVELIAAVCDEIKGLLIEKNTAYGSSALEPMRVFSKASSIDGILVRIDDKLSRIKNMGISTESEDTVKDLIGYLILLKVQQKREQYAEEDRKVDLEILFPGKIPTDAAKDIAISQMKWTGCETGY